jgi:hypothetical protein
MKTSSRRSAWAALASAALLVISPVAPHFRGVAQQPPAATHGPRVSGIVVLESNEQPVESATVSLVGTALEVLTGPQGAFTFWHVPVGTAALRVSAPGHPSVEESLEIADSTVFLQIRLPSAAAVLSEIVVPGARRDQPSIQAARTAADLLALRVPSARPPTGVVGTSNKAVLLRGADSITQTVEPMILIDGVVVSRMGDALDVLALIRASDVEEIQVLSGAEAASLYPFASGGVVIVRTRR